MQKNLFKASTFALFAILFLAHPLSISAAVYQKEVLINQDLKKNKSDSHIKKLSKLGFIKQWIKKKLVKYLLKSELEEKDSNLISLLSVILGGVSLTMIFLVASTPFTALLAAILGVVSLILGIHGLIHEKSSALSGLGILLGGIVTIFLLIGIINSK